MADALVEKGDEGEAVEALQRDLNTLGWVLDVDGRFGASTEAVVKEAQGQLDVTVDGIVGPKTRAALAQASQDELLLKDGAKGAAVEQVQTILGAHGFDVGTVDGIYGTKTIAAVKVLQEKHGLTTDGIVGPRTWRALKSL